MLVLDTSDQAGALGYHDVTPQGLPLGKVFAKTGTLPGVVCLAGYTTTASGRHVRFAFMLNRNDSYLSARRAVDRAVLAIVKFRG